MPDKDFPRLIHESDIALQVCTAGNLRTTLMCARLAWEAGAFARLIIATDTPTGSGIMPLGMLYTIAHLASLGGIAPEVAIAAATGSNARVYRLEFGYSRRRQACGHRADRCAGRRHPTGCAVGDPPWRYRCDRRCSRRWHATLRRQKSQHAGDDAQGASGKMYSPARLLGRGALSRNLFDWHPKAACSPRRGDRVPMVSILWYRSNRLSQTRELGANAVLVPKSFGLMDVKRRVALPQITARPGCVIFNQACDPRMGGDTRGSPWSADFLMGDLLPQDLRARDCVAWFVASGEKMTT